MTEPDLLAEVPPATEAETKFDSSAAWQADSADHEPETAGNDAPVPPTPAIEEAPALATESEGAETQAPAEELARNDQGQFVPKKGKGKARSDPQARVEAATAKEAAAKEEARKAREEVESYKARLATYEAQQRQPASVPEQKTPEAFPAFDEWSTKNPSQDWEQYHRELTRHEARTVAQQAASDQFQQWRAQQDFAAMASAHDQRLHAARQKYPDWDAVLQTGDRALTSALQSRGVQFPVRLFQEAIYTSEKGPDILRDLAQHPEDATQLAIEASTLPVSAVPMLRRILESRLAPTAVAVPDSAPVPSPSQAKPPINRVGGTASAVPLDPDDLDFGPEYVKLENERERKRAAMGRW